MANAAMYVGHFLKLILILLLSRTAQYDDANNCDMNCEECTVSHHFFIHMHLSTGAYNIIKPRRFKASSSIIGYHYTASSYNQPILHHPTNNNIIFHPSSVSALLDRKCGRRLKIIIMGYPQFRSNSLRVDYRLSSSSYVTFTQVLSSCMQ